MVLVSFKQVINSGLIIITRSSIWTSPGWDGRASGVGCRIALTASSVLKKKVAKRAGHLAFHMLIYGNMESSYAETNLDSERTVCAPRACYSFFPSYIYSLGGWWINNSANARPMHQKIFDHPTINTQQICWFKTIFEKGVFSTFFFF
jgi:hypothetical protein